MQSVTINKTRDFEVISHGNGLAYTLANHKLAVSAHVQGEDATDFRELFDCIADANPEMEYNSILWLLWDKHGYGELAEGDQ